MFLRRPGRTTGGCRCAGGRNRANCTCAVATAGKRIDWTIAAEPERSSRNSVFAPVPLDPRQRSCCSARSHRVRPAKTRGNRDVLAVGKRQRAFPWSVHLPMRRYHRRHAGRNRHSLAQVHVRLTQLAHDLLGTVPLLQKRNPFRPFVRQDSLTVPGSDFQEGVNTVVSLFTAMPLDAAHPNECVACSTSRTVPTSPAIDNSTGFLLPWIHSFPSEET